LEKGKSSLEENKVFADMEFQKIKSKQSLESSNNIVGKIYSVTDNFMKNLFFKLKHPGDIKIRKEDIISHVSTIRGSWLQDISIDDITYFKFSELTPSKLKMHTKPIPSDSYHREDLKLKLAGNHKAAEFKRSDLRNQEERDSKLRKMPKSKMNKIIPKL
jgi:hypothetical protein